MSRSKKAFTLIELMVVVVIAGILAAVLVGGVGGGSHYFEERTATIKVLKLYPIASDSGTSYRCYAEVLRNPSGDENLTAETTFEITDDVLKGQTRSADLYGRLREGEVFDITYYGVRVGWASQFPKIIMISTGNTSGLDDLYD